MHIIACCAVIVLVFAGVLTQKETFNFFETLTVFMLAFMMPFIGVSIFYWCWRNDCQCRYFSNRRFWRYGLLYGVIAGYLYMGFDLQVMSATPQHVRCYAR